MTLEESIRLAVLSGIEAGLRPLADRLEAIERRLGDVARDEYLTADQAASIAQVTPDTVRAWVASGKLRRYRAGAGRGLRVSRRELVALSNGESKKATPGEIDAVVNRALRRVK